MKRIALLLLTIIFFQCQDNPTKPQAPVEPPPEQPPRNRLELNSEYPDFFSDYGLIGNDIFDWVEFILPRTYYANSSATPTHDRYTIIYKVKDGNKTLLAWARSKIIDKEGNPVSVFVKGQTYFYLTRIEDNLHFATHELGYTSRWVEKGKTPDLRLNKNINQKLSLP
jgi:hypothetical protein